MAQHLRTDPLQIEPVLETLQDLDWIARLDEPDGERGARFVLLCDPDETPVAPLAEALLLPPDGLNQGFWRGTGLGDLRLRQALA
jgi:membrane protein